MPTRDMGSGHLICPRIYFRMLGQKFCGELLGHLKNDIVLSEYFKLMDRHALMSEKNSIRNDNSLLTKLFPKHNETILICIHTPLIYF